MKKQLLSTVLSVGLAGFSLAAQAQMSPTTPSQPDNASQTTQTNTSSYQSSSSSSLTGAAQVTQVNTAGEVVIGPDAATSSVPQFTIGLGATRINVLNTTPKPIVFSVPTLNLSYQVAANSERLIQVDSSQTASLTPGQQVAYFINDVNGNQLASGTLSNDQEVASMINTNTTVATTEETTTTTTTEHKPASKRATVRGFW